jgi:hypothetical protein
MASPDCPDEKKGSYISDTDKAIKNSPRVSLLIVIELNRRRRNFALFFALALFGLIYWQDWNKWIFILPIILTLFAVLQHCNILLLMHELKRRQGEDATDLNVMKELTEKANASRTKIHKIESVMTAVFVSLQLMAFYGIAIGIWGLVFKKSFLIFGLYGLTVGLLFRHSNKTL